METGTKLIFFIITPNIISTMDVKKIFLNFIGLHFIIVYFSESKGIYDGG